MNDPWEDPELEPWLAHVNSDLIPKLRKSAVTISLVPDDPAKTDIKFAVELGLSIMFDKPIVAVVTPGMQVPDRLVRVVDEIVEWDGTSNPLATEAIIAAIERVVGDD